MTQYIEINNFSDVKKITKINNNLNKKSCNIIAIYLEGCIHCKMLHPEWKKAAKKMKNRKGIVSFINMKYQNNLHIDTSNVYGFPYIFAIKNNNQIEYEGSRDATSLFNWMSSICPSEKKTKKKKKKKIRKQTRRKTIK